MRPPRHMLSTYAVRELLRRPAAFLGGFLCCFAGLLISLNMLLMQYGSYLAEIDRTAEDGHLRLPDLTLDEIAAIDALPYVKRAQAVWTGENYTARIYLVDPTPAKLSATCDRILQDTDLIHSPLCAENPYYANYGPMPNWINTDYQSAATAIFGAEIAPFMLVMALFTAVGLGASVQRKLTQDARDYAAMRSFGLTIPKICGLLAGQYSLLFLAALIPALPLAWLINLAFSRFLAAHFTTEFWQMQFALPLGHTLAVIILLWAMGISAILLTGYRQLHSAASGDRSAMPAGQLTRLSDYPHLFLRRTWRQTFTTALRQTALLCLPVLFILLALFTFGVRAQTERTDCTFSLHMIQVELSATRCGEIADLPGVDRVELLYPRDDGSYSGIRIWCRETAADQLRPQLEGIALADGLLFYDHPRIDQQVILQSNASTAFFLLEAALLYLAALCILAAENFASLQGRRPEFAALRAMGIDHRQLLICCRPVLILAALSLLLSLPIGAVLFASFTEGSLHLRLSLLLPLLVLIPGLHLGVHALLCRRFTAVIAATPPNTLLKEEL